jgi:hypothetical protein
MRSSPRPILAWFVALTILLACPAASARETARVQDGGRDVTYEFYDDPLAAGGIAPRGGGITVVNRRIRTLLIRPRAQFVTEMLKSVENL